MQLICISFAYEALDVHTRASDVQNMATRNRHFNCLHFNSLIQLVKRIFFNGRNRAVYTPSLPWICINLHKLRLSDWSHAPHCRHYKFNIVLIEQIKTIVSTASISINLHRFASICINGALHRVFVIQFGHSNMIICMKFASVVTFDHRCRQSATWKRVVGCRTQSTSKSTINHRQQLVDVNTDVNTHSTRHANQRVNRWVTATALKVAEPN